MDAQTLSTAMGCSLARATQMLPGMENAMRAANINTPLRAAHWCAQIGHESIGLQYMEEIASGAAYNGRADLGNTQPGDGPRYKGSGPIQLTGRANFRAFTKWANAQGHTNIDFEAKPWLVREEPKWGFLAASWYWIIARPQLNSLCDRDDVVGVTRAINGGTNGLQDRKNRLARCKGLGTRLLPSRSSVVSSVARKAISPNPGHRGDPLFLADLLRAWGLTVREMSGWKDRGEGDFVDIVGVMCHHTAGPNTSAEYIARNPNLNNGLSSQIHLGRDGVVTLCGVGIAWHAGGDEARTPAWAKGQVQVKTRHPSKWQSIGNAKMIGVEAVNAGDGSQVWPDVQMKAYITLVAAILWYLNLPIERAIAHKEFAPSRKIDPNFNMTDFRQKVTARRAQGPTNNPQEDFLSTPQAQKMLEDIAAMQRDTLIQLTGNHKVGEFPGFDPFDLAAKARAKLVKGEGLTMMETICIDWAEERTTGDQLSGPGRKDGSRTFTGWNVEDILQVARRRGFVGLTLAQMVVVGFFGTEEDRATVRALIPNETTPATPTNKEASK